MWYMYWAFSLSCIQQCFSEIDPTSVVRKWRLTESCGPSRVAIIVFCFDVMTEIEYSVFLTKAQRCYFITHVSRKLLDLIEVSARPSQRYVTEPHFRTFRISISYIFFPLTVPAHPLICCSFLSCPLAWVHPSTKCINTCSLIYSKFLACVSSFDLILVCPFRPIFSNICNLCSPRDKDHNAQQYNTVLNTIIILRAWTIRKVA
jgi:hypothetical protein